MAHLTFSTSMFTHLNFALPFQNPVDLNEILLDLYNLVVKCYIYLPNSYLV